jgi:serine/threonine protein kinase/formylglycine-generating enzyme required for sulfatase activity
MRECPTCRTCLADDVVYCPVDGAQTQQSIQGDPILDGRYQLERRLGQGGMGIVYKARHIFLKTQHAIKIILPDLVGNDPNLVTRFRQEALAAAAIRHQNIIAVTDFGVVRGTMPFLVMEFVQGRSLQDLMAEENAMGPVRAFELMQPICSGIAAAHRQKIVHRDLKPLNVMIQEGIPIAEGTKILDFGLAKIKSGELLGSFVAAQTTGLMGSPFYMAPEQWSDEPPDTRADVYSLGVMFYQMLCGEVPFKGNSIPAIMKKHLSEEVPTFASRGIEVPPQIEAVVRHALEKEPEYRTHSADDFLSELRDAMAAASALLKTTGDSAAKLDPLKTIATAPATISPGSQTTSDPLAGTISGTSLVEEEEKLRVAREELAREEEAKRKLAQAEAERKRKEEEQRVEEEKRAAEEREREVEKLRQEEKQREEERQRAEERRREEERVRVEELVSRQTKAIEEKLSQLAASMPPTTTAVVDPEATQIQAGTGAATVTENSFPTMTGAPTAVAAPKKSMLPLILAAVLAVFVLGGGAIIGLWMLKSSRTTGGPGQPTPENPTPGNPTPEPVAYKPEFVMIPAGTFQMGRTGATVAEVPVHAVTVTPFYIDKHEVTNAEYQQFVKETKHQAPSNWVGDKPIQGQELLPVTFVSFDDARAFAEWRSKRDGVKFRLPTEEEWEYAARGGDQNNIYPWGNQWVESNAITKSSGVTMPKPVGSMPNDKTRWGAMDMMGNVYEWTSTKASYYAGSAKQVEGEQRNWYIVRGASYGTEQTPKPISATRRDWFAESTKVSVLGFRLVRPA